MKRLIIILSASAIFYCADAISAEPVKFTGELSNYSYYQTREFYTDASGVYNTLPSAVARNLIDLDLNSAPSTRLFSLYSRLGATWNHTLNDRSSISCKAEAELASSIAGSFVFKLRQAYVNYTLGGLNLLAGQTWHPFADERPGVVNISCGAPYNPYNLSPQFKLGYTASVFNITASTLWQAAYKSNGPNGFSVIYQRYSMIPEATLQASVSFPWLTARVGGDYLNIKPRNMASYNDVTIWSSDRARFLSAYAYLESSFSKFRLQAKGIYAQGGEWLGLPGGYAVSKVVSEAECDYTPFQVVSGWFNASYEGPVRVNLFAGYVRNLGVLDTVVGASYMSNVTSAYFLKAFRAAPSISWTFCKHFRIAAEYSLDGVWYGSGYQRLNGLYLSSETLSLAHSALLGLSFVF